MADLCQLHYQPDMPQEPPWNMINFANGVWDIERGEFINHQLLLDQPPFFLSRIPHNFKPEQTDIGHIDSLFDDWVSPEYKVLLYELAGYCLLRCNYAQKFFILYGPGNNGKTTYAELLRRIVGPKNCSAISMDDIMSDRFALSSLRGKLLNISGELVPTLKRTDRIKLLTGGDEVFAQEKFKRGYSFQPYAKLLFLGNSIPSTPDSTPGFYRRTVIVPFIKEIPPEKENPQLIRQIKDNEIQGLLGKLVMKILPQFIERGFNFSMNPSVDDLREQWESLSDPLQTFFEEYFLPDDVNKEFIPNPVINQLYDAHCQKAGITRINSREFATQMRKEGYQPVNRRLPPEEIKKWQEVGFEIPSPCRGWWCNGVTLVTDNSILNSGEIKSKKMPLQPPHVLQADT
jgi:putative DNA primase/helicase